jgi:hypothetical protein
LTLLADLPFHSNRLHCKKPKDSFQKQYRKKGIRGILITAASTIAIMVIFNESVKDALEESLNERSEHKDKMTKMMSGRKLMLTIAQGYEVPWPEPLMDGGFAFPKDY